MNGRRKERRITSQTRDEKTGSTACRELRCQRAAGCERAREPLDGAGSGRMAGQESGGCAQTVYFQLLQRRPSQYGVAAPRSARHCSLLQPPRWRWLQFGGCGQSLSRGRAQSPMGATVHPDTTNLWMRQQRGIVGARQPWFDTRAHRSLTAARAPGVSRPFILLQVKLLRRRHCHLSEIDVSLLSPRRGRCVRPAIPASGWAPMARVAPVRSDTRRLPYSHLLHFRAAYTAAPIFLFRIGGSSSAGRPG